MPWSGLAQFVLALKENPRHFGNCLSYRYASHISWQMITTMYIVHQWFQNCATIHNFVTGTCFTGHVNTYVHVQDEQEACSAYSRVSHHSHHNIFHWKAYSVNSQIMTQTWINESLILLPHPAVCKIWACPLNILTPIHTRISDCTVCPQNITKWKEYPTMLLIYSLIIYLKISICIEFENTSWALCTQLSPTYLYTRAENSRDKLLKYPYSV